MRKYLVGLLAIGLLLATRTSAFSLKPSKLYVTVDPGTKQEVQIIIKNSESTTRTYNLSVATVNQDSAGRPVFNKVEDVAQKWVSPRKKTVEIGPGKEAKVVFDIGVPADAQPLPHYLGLVAKENVSNNGGLGLSSQLAALLTLQISGQAKEDLTVTEWKADRTLYTNDKWNFDLKMVNNGTVDVQTDGNLLVRNWRGSVLHKQNVPLGNRILARSERNLVVPVVFKGFFPGAYQIDMRVNYGRLGQSVVRVEHLFYLPILGTAVCFLALIAIIFAGIFFYRKLKRNA